MEVHSRRGSIIAKKAWNLVRITFFMMRKGLISKKKLLMDINMLFKRGRLIRKNVMSLLHHHHHQQMTHSGYGLGQRECEFSCSNSPNSLFFHVSSYKKRKNHHIHLPCLNPPPVLDELEPQEVDDDNVNALALVPKTPEYSFNLCFDGSDLAPGETRSPLRSPIKISDYLSEDESDAENVQVDHQAEEFIKKFHEQLRAQSRVQFLQF